MFPSICEFNSQYNALVFDAKYLELYVVRNADEDSDIEKVVNKLTMSPRTLRRKLTKEGSRFQQLKDNARRDRAINLLEQRNLSISEIGLKIGFTEAATFSRPLSSGRGFHLVLIDRIINKLHIQFISLQ
jgi:AraC-like DNA-binding protein